MSVEIAGFEPRGALGVTLGRAPTSYLGRAPPPVALGVRASADSARAAVPLLPACRLHLRTCLTLAHHALAGGGGRPSADIPLTFRSSEGDSESEDLCPVCLCAYEDDDAVLQQQTEAIEAAATLKAFWSDAMDIRLEQQSDRRTIVNYRAPTVKRGVLPQRIVALQCLCNNCICSSNIRIHIASLDTQCLVLVLA